MGQVTAHFGCDNVASPSVWMLAVGAPSRVLAPRRAPRGAVRRAVPAKKPPLVIRAASHGDDAPADASARRPRLVDPSNESKKRVTTTGAKRAVETCVACGGVGVVECRACGGKGTLAAGGFHAKNHVDMANVVGTNWTAHRRTKGWRHFECIGKSPADKANGKPRASVHLAATCDRDVTVWVDVKELKDRHLWSAGWKQREDLDWIGDPDQPGGAVAVPKPGAPCVACDGEGRVPCQRRGCVNGAERVRKQREVIERTERTFKKVIKATRGEGTEGEAGEAAAELRRRMKRQLKDMAKAKPGGRAGRDRGDTVSRGNNGNGEEDWGAWGRRRRDEKLDKWMRAGAVPDEDWPEDDEKKPRSRRRERRRRERDAGWDDQQ